MIKVINGFFSILKVLLLLVSFVFTFYIIINMYRRLDKDLIGAISNFIPFILLFILFAVNIIFKQKSVNESLFYNISCCMVFALILFAVYRTFYDKNMIAIIRLGYDVNFNYFADIIAPIKAMLYMLSMANILLIVDEVLKNIGSKQNKEVLVKKKEVVVKKKKLAS